MIQLATRITIKERRDDNKTKSSVTRAIMHNGCKKDRLRWRIYVEF